MLVSYYGSAIINGITKLAWLKNKRILLIVLAVVFVGGIFFLKSKSEHKNEIGDKIGLAYGEVKIGDLVSQDTDLDGVPDWEEGLWGTNPNLKDTDGDGTEDKVAIDKLKTENDAYASAPLEEENLTQTDKFSRELFSTVATLTQSGPIDEETVEKLGETLSDQLQNVPIRKIFLASEIKTTATDDKAAAQTYNVELGKLSVAYPMQGNVLNILQEFINSGDEPDTTILLKLDPIIAQTNKFLAGMNKIQVPPSILPFHLNLMNALEQTIENLEDLQTFDSDSVVAMGAMSKYGQNSELLQESLQKLSTAISEKLYN